MKRPTQTSKVAPVKKSSKRDLVVLSNQTLKMVTGGQGIIITGLQK